MKEREEEETDTIDYAKEAINKEEINTVTSGRKRSATNKKEEESTVEGSENSDTNTGVCEECGTIYADDTQEGKEKWMGCYNCPQWYCYDSLELMSINS